MDTALKVILGALIAVILGLMLVKQGKDMAVLLSIAACCMVAVTGIVFLTPVIDFVRTLYDSIQLDADFLRILLKAVGIGLIAEIAGLICKDAGNAALEKTIQILASAVILWLSLPLLQALLELVQKMMEDV